MYQFCSSRANYRYLKVWKVLKRTVVSNIHFNNLRGSKSALNDALKVAKFPTLVGYDWMITFTAMLNNLKCLKKFCFSGEISHLASSMFLLYLQQLLYIINALISLCLNTSEQNSN